MKINLFNIVDYKLKGAKPTKSDLENGLSLQLPVYLLAGKQILKEENNLEFEGNDMIIFSLNYKDEKFGSLPIRLKGNAKLEQKEKRELNESLLEVTKGHLINYHNKIKNGTFNISELENREDKVCKYCDFKSFCRVKEIFE